MEFGGRGFFITLEGVEGCGKSTQAKLLFEYLVENGFKAVLTREPGATNIGRTIRDALLSKDSGEMDARAELMLFAACRAQHVAEIIKPALGENKVVVCDRYVDSTMAYQAYGRGLPIGEVQRISDFSSRGLVPELTFLLDIPVEESFKRIDRGKMDRIESADRNFHERVSLGFHEAAARYPERIRVIDASGSITAIHQQIINVIAGLSLV